MAESKAKIEFDLKLKQSEEIPDKFACFLCKIIPRKAPIYQIFETKMVKDRVHLGKIICVDCTRFGWDFGYVEGYRGMRHERNEILEAMLFVSPPTCKYKKNGCKYVQDLKKLEYEDDIYHERECKFRDVSCPAKDCKKPMPFLNLKYHMESECDGKFFKNGLLRKKVIEMYSAFDVEITNWETYETFVYEDDGYIWYSQMSKEYVYLTGSMQLHGSKNEALEEEQIVKREHYEGVLISTYHGKIYVPAGLPSNRSSPRIISRILVPNNPTENRWPRYPISLDPKSDKYRNYRYPNRSD